MNTRFLEAFLWAARMRSFTAAAEKLHITQAAISGRISSLETDFGRPLFDRSTRMVSLTDAGLALLPYAERMLELNRSMHAAVGGQCALRGRVRVGVIESIVHTWLVSFVRRVDAAHPALELELTVESTERLHERIASGDLDLALQTDPVVHSSVHNIPLGSMRLGWVCASDSDLPSHAPLRVFAARPLVTFTRGSHPHRAVLQLCDAAGVAVPRLHCVTSIAAITRLLPVTRGVATLPLAAARAAMDSGRVRQVSCDEARLPDLPLVASFRPTPDSGLAEALLRFAIDEAAASALADSPADGLR